MEQDAENSYLATDAVSEDPMNQLPGHSITYRIAVGPQAGRKVFTLQTLPACEPDDYADTASKASGFSLHAGVAARSDECKKPERLCRYIIRPAVSERRLSLTSSGNIRYQLKTPYRDGTTHVIFEPLDFMARLAALVPKPRANLTRFHGVFAPNSKHRALITPAKRGKSTKRQINGDVRSAVEQHAAMSWAQRLKRVFNIDISTCDVCGSAVKVIARGLRRRNVWSEASANSRMIFRSFEEHSGNYVTKRIGKSDRSGAAAARRFLRRRPLVSKPL